MVPSSLWPSTRSRRGGSLIVIAALCWVLAGGGRCEADDHRGSEEWAALAERGAELAQRDPATLNVRERRGLENYLVGKDYRRRYAERLKPGWKTVLDGLDPEEKKALQAATDADLVNRHPEAALMVPKAEGAAQLYDELGQPDRARELRQRGIAIGEAILNANPTARWRALPCYGLVRILAELREPNAEHARKAREYADIALATSDEDRDFITRTRLLVPLAKLHANVRQWDRAEHYAREVLQRPKPELIGNFGPHAGLILGRALAAMGKKSEAIAALQQATRDCPARYEDMRGAIAEELRRLGVAVPERSDSAASGP